jgi:ribose transport system permease protein
VTTLREPGTGRRDRRLTDDGRRLLLAAGALLAVLAVGAALNPAFVSGGSLRANLVIASFIGLAAAGQMVVVLVGGIDLSAPWVINAAAITLVSTSLGRDDRAAIGVGAALLLGLLAGLVNGVGIACFAMPPVVMTLGMNGIMEGLTLGRSQGLTCASCVSYAPAVLRALYDRTVLGVPYALIGWLVVAVLISAVEVRTAFGRRIYAIGTNRRASFLAGVAVRRSTVALYMLSGLFSALCGIALVAYGGQPNLGMGDPFLFQSIAAVVLGGVSIVGGQGRYAGVVAGAFTLVALVGVLQGRRWLAESDRNIVYGVSILALLLLYGRSRRAA